MSIGKLGVVVVFFVVCLLAIGICLETQYRRQQQAIAALTPDSPPWTCAPASDSDRQNGWKQDCFLQTQAATGENITLKVSIGTREQHQQIAVNAVGYGSSLWSYVWKRSSHKLGRGQNGCQLDVDLQRGLRHPGLPGSIAQALRKTAGACAGTEDSLTLF